MTQRHQTTRLCRNLYLLPRARESHLSQDIVQPIQMGFSLLTDSIPVMAEYSPLFAESPRRAF